MTSAMLHISIASNLAIQCCIYPATSTALPYILEYLYITGGGTDTVVVQARNKVKFIFYRMADPVI